MYLYGHTSDREWLFLLFSYFGFVHCMDKRCHEIVYIKLWPNMDSNPWECTILTDARVYRHVPTHLHSQHWVHPTHRNRLKKHDRAKPACCPATPDTSMPLRESFDHIWAFISFVISRGLHRGLLPKRDKVVESTHTNGLVFWGSCSPSCGSTASSIAGSSGHLGWNTEGLSCLCRRFSLCCPRQWRPGQRTGSDSCAVSPVTK